MSLVKSTEKTVSIKLDIFPCGNAKTATNLTIACSESGARFKTTLSDNGLQKFRQKVLEIYRRNVRHVQRISESFELPWSKRPSNDRQGILCVCGYRGAAIAI